MTTSCKTVHRSLLKIGIFLAAGLMLAGCVSSVLDADQRGSQPIPTALVSKMKAKAMSPADPIVVRIFKQESELEIWKRTRGGQYALLKTYPMCRWSGKLGPKTRAGDRQAPEGFYSIPASMLNPKSQYYLSVNLGYPNRLEQALGHTGEALMIHGACSSSGCYAMTDEGVGEIYAVGREALKGGQRAFQVQAYPFRMTAENMAKHRGDPNHAFWQRLKQGYDLFETTRKPPQVGYCGGGYAFKAEGQDAPPADPLAACPATENYPLIALQGATVADDPTAPLTTGSTTSSTRTYADGGMHPVFRKMLERSGPASFAKRTSNTGVPISRPEAALADPYMPAR